MVKKALPMLLIVALAALALPLVVFAQNGNPPSDTPGAERRFYGPGRRGGRMGGGWMGGGVALVDVMADLTDMTADEVVAALQSGDTYADIAQRADVELETLVDEIIAYRAAALDDAVAEGWITQEHADWMLDQMSEHLMDRLQGEWAPRGGYGYDAERARPYGGKGRMGGRGGRGGRRGPLGAPRGGYGSGCPYGQPGGPEA